MARIQILALTLLMTSLSLAQSLMIYTNDQTPLKFEIAAIDSITISTVPLAKGSGSSSWNMYTIDPTTAESVSSPSLLIKTSDGLQIIGSADRISKAVYSAPIFENPAATRVVYLKWKVLGKAGDEVNVTFDLESFDENMSSNYPIAQFTSGSAANSIAIDSWYFSRLVINERQAVVTTCCDNYDDHLGTIYWRSLIELPRSVATFSLRFQAPRTARLLIGKFELDYSIDQ